MPKLTQLSDGLWTTNNIVIEKPIIYEAPVMIQSGICSISKIGAFSYINANLNSKNVNV